VAAVRPAASGANRVSGGCHGIDSHYGPNDSPPPLDRCVIADGRLSHLIFIGWQLGAISQIKGAQDWVSLATSASRYRPKRKIPRKTTEKQPLEMLKGLIVESFHLKYHLEQSRPRNLDFDSNLARCRFRIS
jgi:uncharacterized protein (TIGR03435 family)